MTPARRTRRFAAAPALAAVVLALSGTAPALASFDWVVADRGAVTALDVTTSFHTDITNTGTAAETYNVTLTSDMSADWLTTLCDINLCYPPFLTTLQYTLPPGGSMYLGVNLTPMVTGGRGVSTVSVSSASAPAQAMTATFTILTPGPEVLVVDADGVAGAPGVVLASVTASGRTSGLWDRTASGKLEAAELAGFPAVLWHAGDDPLGLDAADRAALAAYVAGGGRLLVGGANLAFQVCDPGGAFYDPAAVAWFAATLGAGYAANASGTPLVAGVPGDPVGDGLSFTIDGGGANTLPDVLTAQGGLACLRYAGGPVAAIRHQDGDGKSLFLGFGLAGIADGIARDALVDAALDWLATDASPVPPLPAAAALGLEAAPNPFNPRTTLWLDNAGAPAVTARLDIYDLRGRHVRALYRGALVAGRTAVAWDGRDDGGRPQPGGPYLARLSAPGAAPVIVKLMLAK